jgi:hypothetical protein
LRTNQQVNIGVKPCDLIFKLFLLFFNRAEESSEGFAAYFFVQPAPAIKLRVSS